MGFGKSSPFLALSILVLCQAGSLQATSLRWDLESPPDSKFAALNEKDGHLLLASLLKAYAQRSTNGLVQYEAELRGKDLRPRPKKRACNVSTCVIERLADFLSKYAGIHKEGFVPTNVGPYAFGRRRRELQA